MGFSFEYKTINIIFCKKVTLQRTPTGALYRLLHNGVHTLQSLEWACSCHGLKKNRALRLFYSGYNEMICLNCLFIMTDFSIRVYITFDEIESYQYITNIHPIALDQEKVTESGIKMY
jgi:hypothetical protein